MIGVHHVQLSRHRLKCLNCGNLMPLDAELSIADFVHEAAAFTRRHQLCQPEHGKWNPFRQELPADVPAVPEFPTRTPPQSAVPNISCHVTAIR